MYEGRSHVLSEWKAGALLVVASTIGMSFYSVLIGSLGLMMDPMTKEFGWSRTLLSSGPGIATAITAAISPFAGMFIDRFGTRRLVLPGLALTLTIVASFSLVSGAAWQWLALWAVYGTISASIKSTSWTTAVLGVFDRSRGLALSITYSGMAITAIFIGPLGNWLITDFGWRAAYVWLAVGWGGFAWLTCALFFFDVHDRAARKRKREGAAHVGPALVDLPGLTVREAWRNSALWRIAISVFLVMALTNGLSIHLFPIMTGAGVSRANAAWLLSLGGAAGIAGSFVTGVLLDRYRVNWVGGITLVVMAVAFALLMDGIRSPALIVFALIANGYAAGTKVQIAGMLTADYAGMKNFGTIYGVMGGLIALAGGLGPMAAGLVFDMAGGYGPFLALGVAGCAFSGLLVMTLPRSPNWRTNDLTPQEVRPA